jgi:hypothetical protein
MVLASDFFQGCQASLIGLRLPKSEIALLATHIHFDEALPHPGCHFSPVLYRIECGSRGVAGARRWPMLCPLASMLFI